MYTSIGLHSLTLPITLLLPVAAVLFSVLLFAEVLSAPKQGKSAWRTVRAVGVVASLMVIIAGNVSVQAIAQEERDTAIEKLESEYGLAYLSPIGESTISSCSFARDDQAAEFTWLNETGERDRGLLSMSKLKGGACGYSLTPESEIGAA